MTTPNLDLYLPSIVNGDADAFGHFVAAAELQVRLTLRSFAAHVDTEAIVQEAFLRVWQAAPRFVSDGLDNALIRFTTRIARNLAVSETRKRRTLPEGELASETADPDHPEAIAPDPLLRKVILLCLEKLSGPTRNALAARLSSGGIEPDAAIAEKLGMRPNTFLQNVTRGRKLVAECLETQGISIPGQPQNVASSETP